VFFRGYPFLSFRHRDVASRFRLETHIVLCLTFILVAAISGLSQSKAEREVSDTVKRWAASIVSRDMDALGQIMADDIVITDYNGKVRGKKEELEILKPSPDVKTISVENEDVKIKIHGKTAVVAALTIMVFNIGGRDTSMSMRYTAVFVKRERRWQIVALQTARLPPPKK
jgi:ketosteroid isomerase-like protein